VLDFAQRAGVRVFYGTERLTGKRSSSVSGTLTPEDALGRLLAGTGISYRFTSPSAVTIGTPERASAIDNTPAGGLDLDTINVDGSGDGTIGYVATLTDSGTKTETPIREIPQTINKVTRDELDQRGAQDFNAAVAYTPGVRAIDYPGGQGTPDFYLRGFRVLDQVGNYRDGLRNGFNSYDTDIELYGLQRLDIVKGPASVLFGQMAPGGLVNAISKRPTETRFNEIQLLGGSFDRYQGAFDFGGPADKDGKVLYRLTGLWRDSGTQIDHSPDDRIYIAPALTWRPNAQTSFTLFTSYQKTRKGGSEQSLPMDNTIFNKGIRIPSSLYLGAPGLSNWNVDNYSVGYEFKHEFDSGWKFNQNARYVYSDVKYISAWGSDWPPMVIDNRYFTIGLQDRPKTSNAVVIDNNITKSFDTGPLRHEILLGADYGYYNGRETRTNSNEFHPIDIKNPTYNFGFTFGTPWSSTRSVASQVGLYAQDQIKFQKWVLTAGGRYDWSTNDQYNYNSQTINPGPDTVDRLDSKAFTGRVGLAYLFDNGMTPYASYSTSFQPQVGVDALDAMFKPTTGQQYEVGLKYQPVGWNSFITLSLFDLTQQNVVTNDRNGNSVQQGEARSRGVEIEGKASLTDGLSLIASYAYIDARTTKDIPNAAGFSAIGTRTPAVPANMAAFWLDYTFQSGPLLGLGLGAGVRYVGASDARFDTDLGTQVTVPGYTLLDATVRYDLGQLRPALKGATFAVTATNLTDERYFTPGFYSNTVLYGNRRNVIGTLTYRW